MKQNNRKIACMLAVGAMMLPATILSASAAPAVSVQSVQQAAKVFGTVTDGKEPVIGASIRVKNGNQGTTVTSNWMSLPVQNSSSAM